MYCVRDFMDCDKFLEIFAKTLFGMNVKGQKTLTVWEINCKSWEGI